MIPEQRNSHPLPPMDDEPTPDSGDAMIVGYALPGERITEARLRQLHYEAHRRAYAEAIGRPYPAERHAVWPR